MNHLWRRFKDFFRHKNFYCPACGKKAVVEGNCPTCFVPLLSIGYDKATFVEMVPVFQCTGIAQLAVAKSMLEEEGIRYFVKNEASSELFGIGSFGTGYNTAIGPLMIAVEKERAVEARELLEALNE